MAVLIAFYSRADENYFGGAMKYIKIGNTEKAANMIADITKGDVFKIEQKVPYSADYNTCIEQVKNDKNKKARPELIALPENISGYDEIYLGYPNYWGTMPMAVYTFLESFDFTGIKIHPLYPRRQRVVKHRKGYSRCCKRCDCRKGTCDSRK